MNSNIITPSEERCGHGAGAGASDPGAQPGALGQSSLGGAVGGLATENHRRHLGQTQQGRGQRDRGMRDRHVGGQRQLQGSCHGDRGV